MVPSPHARSWQLPGKENAKRRQAINKKIRKLVESGPIDGALTHESDTASSTSSPAKPPQQHKGGASKGQHQKNKDKRDGSSASPTRRPYQTAKSPFKVAKSGSGGPEIVRVLDENLVPHEYERHGRVGKGSFATCYKATKIETGETLCLKVTDLCAKKIDTVDVRDEMNFLRRMHHPNCLSLYGCVHTHTHIHTHAHSSQRRVLSLPKLYY